VIPLGASSVPVDPIDGAAVVELGEGEEPEVDEEDVLFNPSGADTALSPVDVVVPFEVVVSTWTAVSFDCAELDSVFDESGSVGSANTIPGWVTTAAPTPSATANAPTRPIHPAYSIADLPLKMRYSVKVLLGGIAFVPSMPEHVTIGRRLTPNSKSPTGICSPEGSRRKILNKRRRTLGGPACRVPLSWKYRYMAPPLLRQRQKRAYPVDPQTKQTILHLPWRSCDDWELLDRA
jgi:hypothetical protein